MHWFPDSLGWFATAVFCISYFSAAATLRRWQAAAASLWVAYGAAIHSLPVIAANVLVAGFALLPPRWLRRAPRAATSAGAAPDAAAVPPA